PSRSGYQGSQNARRGVGSAHFTGLKTRLSGDRGSYLIGPHDYPINVIGGYKLSPSPPHPHGARRRGHFPQNPPPRPATPRTHEQAMRDIRAEQKLRPEEAGPLNVVSQKQLAIGTVAQDARMSKKPPHDLLTAALQYAALGLSVVPVHSINGDGWCSCRDGKS